MRAGNFLFCPMQMKQSASYHVNFMCHITNQTVPNNKWQTINRRGLFLLNRGNNGSGKNNICDNANMNEKKKSDDFFFWSKRV